MRVTCFRLGCQPQRRVKGQDGTHTKVDANLSSEPQFGLCAGFCCR